MVDGGDNIKLAYWNTVSGSMGQVRSFEAYF